MATNRRRLMLLILGLGVGLVIAVLAIPRTAKRPTPSTTDMPDAADSSTHVTDSGTSSTQPDTWAASRDDRPHADQAQATRQRPDPPAPTLPNKFERAKFSTPVRPRYLQPASTKLISEAVQPDSPAPKIPHTAPPIVEKQLAEESELTSQIEAKEKAAGKVALE